MLAIIHPPLLYVWTSELHQKLLKALLLKHIRQNNDVGTPFKELQQVLPGLTRGQIQRLMQELKDSHQVYPQGKTSAARWFANV